jgi:hypothetical protein
MAVDLATLGLEVKSQPVEQATKNLKDFKKEAKEAEAAAVSVGEKGSAGLAKLSKEAEKASAVTVKYAKSKGGVWEWNDRIAISADKEAAATARATAAANANTAALTRQAAAARAAETALRAKRMADAMSGMRAGLGAAVDAGIAGSGLGGLGIGAAALTGGVGALATVLGVVGAELVTWGVQAIVTANKTKTLAEATDDHAAAVARLGKSYQLAEGFLDDFAKKSDLVAEAQERQDRRALEKALQMERFRLIGGPGQPGRLETSTFANGPGLQEFAKFAPAVQDLLRELRAGQGDFNRFQERLRDIAGTDPKLLEKADQLTIMTAAAAAAADQLARINGELGTLGSGKGSRLGGPGAMEGAQQQFDQALDMAKRFGIPGVSRTGLSDEQKKAFRDSERAAISARNAYRDLIKSAQDRIAQMELESEVVGEVGIKAERLRFELELLNDAQDKGRKITPQQREEIKKLGDEYERLAERTARAQLQAELLFERDQLLRSATDQRIASELRGAGLPIDFDSFEAGLIRTNETLREARDLIGGFFQDFASGLEQGESLWDSFADAGVNALSRIADKLIEMATDQLISSLFGTILGVVGGGGGGGGFNAFQDVFDTGFDKGGYTGGRRGKPAGVVHGEEFVVNAEATRRNRPALEAMNNNQPFGGGGGGFVNAPSFNIDARGAQMGVAEQIASALAAWDKGSVQRLARDFPNLRKRTGMV